jgi:hypothetical protein
MAIDAALLDHLAALTRNRIGYPGATIRSHLRSVPGHTGMNPATGEPVRRWPEPAAEPPSDQCATDTGVDLPA